MNDPREDAKTDTFADARRQLCQLEGEIKATGRDYDRIVREGADHFQALHQKAAGHLDESTVDEYVGQTNALAVMQDRHATAASRAAKL